MDETLDDFVEGNFFLGDLFVDKSMECYKRLGLKKDKVHKLITDKRVLAVYKLAGKIASNWNYGLSHGKQYCILLVAVRR